MNQPPLSLDDLRREIDRIDSTIHDLIMERAQLAGRIGAVKGPQAVHVRPAREAYILRRLMRRHSGPFPRLALVQMWREMMNVFTQMQGPFEVAVPPDLWAVARDQYGAMTPLVQVPDGAAALRAIGDGVTDVAVAPWPRDGEPLPWWRLLMEPGAPAMVACLPFCGPDSPVAVTVAPVPVEPTGDDMSMIGVADGKLARERLGTALAEAGLSVRALHVCADQEAACAEIDGFVAETDPAVARLRDALPGGAVRVLGAFAKPILVTDQA